MNSRLSAIVAGSLAGVLILCVAAIAVLAGLDKSSPGVLENLAAGALGALAALLARVGGTEDVRVVNAAHEAVPVDPDAGAGELRLITLVALGVVAGLLLLQLLRALV